jgi:hypothetical protein
VFDNRLGSWESKGVQKNNPKPKNTMNDNAIDIALNRWDFTLSVLKDGKIVGPYFNVPRKAISRVRTFAKRKGVHLSIRKDTYGFYRVHKVSKPLNYGGKSY